MSHWLEVECSLRYSKEPSTGSVLRQSHAALSNPNLKIYFNIIKTFRPLYSKPSLFFRVPHHADGMYFCSLPKSHPPHPPYCQLRLVSLEEQRLFSSRLCSFNRHSLLASFLFGLIIVHSTTILTTPILCPFFNVIHNTQKQINGAYYTEIACPKTFVKLQIE